MSSITSQNVQDSIQYLDQRLDGLSQKVQNLSSVASSKKAPSLCAKLAAAALSIVALACIAVLAASVVAICGAFPLLLAFLNTYTIGAAVSLPIVGCVSTALLVLSTLTAEGLLS